MDKDGETNKTDVDLTALDLKGLQEEYLRLKEICSVKSDIVSIAAHQIRTSLSAMKWIIKMFLDGDVGKMNPEQENLIRKAYEGNDRAIGVVSELLLVNKTEDILDKKYIFTKVDLAELINNVLFDFTGEAYAKGVEIIFLKPERTHNASADKDKARVVIQNLIENAIKYSDMHGKIFITLKELDHMIQVSVKDTGVGISDGGRSKIFQKFYRDPEAEKKEIVGSGIGLYTSKKIIEDHGGQIWFESNPGEGTTFFFTLPINK
ncbi:MAG: HAMP domain-containing histidine kinase [Candidatus Pacebacteria bacterium]|nr:HAMP domain-containing histidine kinase [Candidatus Paceibacterota bacterium]MBP9851613.1 HAMP domain-containing histidine kinase [Candidatus Paceibacterota bacterium]